MLILGVILGLACAQTPGWGEDCDLHARGFMKAMKKPSPSPFGLDGLYINCGSGSGGPNGTWGVHTVGGT